MPQSENKNDTIECVEDYLNNVTSQIHSKRKKLDTRMEISSHIYEKIDFLMLSGMKYEDAAEKAVKEMGS